MGVAADLGYVHPSVRFWQRWVQRAAGTAPGGWVFAHTLRHLDDVVVRASRGTRSAPELLAGLPVLELTSTGRKSGKPRTSHLIALPVGDTLALLGTNFGQSGTPAWVLNLEHDPHALVSYKGHEVEVLARPAEGGERDAVLGAAAAIYPGYLRYLERISGREVRFFVLEPAGR